MDYKYIEQLLERYWQCETTPEEENVLRAFFAQDMEQQESLKRVREIMSGLPEAQRTALQLREIEGHSYRETADIMNVSEANVKVLIFRARQAVKNKIDKIENYGL